MWLYAPLCPLFPPCFRGFRLVSNVERSDDVHPLWFCCIYLCTIQEGFQCGCRYISRLSLHLQVHHSGTDGLAAGRGAFLHMVILVLFASIVLSAPELLKFLPWRLTNFCMASKGFPTYPAFKWLHTCSILVSISYILSQALLLCPLGTVAVYSDDGKKVRQSVALPSAPQLATYLHSSGR